MAYLGHHEKVKRGLGFMRPLGARKTRHHICGHQDCAICRPCWPAKGGRSAENRSDPDALQRDQWWPENAAERRLDAYEAERIARRESRKQRLLDLGFDEVTPVQRADNLNDALDQFCDQ